MMSSDPGPETLRLDRWLWHVRLYKTRSLASEAVSGGRVHLNGERVKPAKIVKVGDRVSVSRGGGLQLDCEVLALPERRGPAHVAQACYAESAESIARRERQLEQRRLAGGFAAAATGRPDKHERRALRRLRGRDAG